MGVAAARLRAVVFLVAVFLAAAAVRRVPVTTAAEAVRVWQGTLELPTYAEDSANPNPPFDFFTAGRFNYPYPLRDGLTDRRETVAWRSLNLENEYLRLTVLPDLGGHVYSCLDKRSGREMFYSNTAIKKALIGYRGAWAAFGVEFNFPVSHNWMSMSPVDFATSQNADGSGSIHVGNVDQVYGSQWRVELRLSPGRAVLEQHVELYNSSDVRHRYYWWTNAAVRAWEDSRLVYPTEAMATHGFTSVEPWPIDRQGRDLSVIRNQTNGPVSLFTFGTREEFVGVYHPRTNSGTVHVAARSDLPVHKVWSWGYDREAAFWRSALSDDDSGYVELQAGLFRNQETYAFLEPQASLRFSEYWIPVRDLGGITRASADAVLHVERVSPTHVGLALDVTRDVPGARISIRGGRQADVSPGTLSPRDVWRAELDEVTQEPLTFELRDANGRILLSHTEHAFDRTPAAQIRFGPQPDVRPSRDSRSADSIAEAGTLDELEGRRLAAITAYRAGLEQHRDSLALNKAAGRLAVALGWPSSLGPASTRSIDWLRAAHARNTTDAETEYYLGLALARAGDTREGGRLLESAHRFHATRAAGGLQLARLSAREGDLSTALRIVQAAIERSPRAWVAGALEVATLRRLGRVAEAVERARHWRAIDPTCSLLRYELTLAGQPDPALWTHLAADANRVLDVADHYLAMGDYAAALRLLERVYPPLAPPLVEPGAVAPQASPLVAYYRGYVRERLAQSGAADYARARSLPTTYVFPSRPSSYAVLNAALKTDPDDATARFLLGSLYLSGGLVDEAIDAWQYARRLRRDIPTLHRNLGLALLRGRGDYDGARAVLEEGTVADPANVDVFLTLDAVLSAANVAPRARVSALERFPADKMPSSLVFRLALAHADAGDAASAESLFHGRFFPREEGGTAVRTVYAQVQLAGAGAVAGAARCADARSILDSMSRQRDDLPFTQDGLADSYRPPLMARQIAAIEWTCGRRAAARATWDRLARDLATATAPLSVAVAAEARQRLGRPFAPADRRRIENALKEADRVLDAAATSSPGLLEYARGLLLGALGRAADSRDALRRVFLHPDRGLSHAVARDALRSGVRSLKTRPAGPGRDTLTHSRPPARGPQAQKR